jgi:6-methylsalicylate decarboxylase
MFDSTRAVTNMILSGVLERHPDMTVIMPHAGAALPVLANRIELLLPLLTPPGEAAAPSVRAALRTLHFDLAGAPVSELLEALMNVTDIENIHYGSDYPFTPAHACVELADRIDQTSLLQGPNRDKVLLTNSEQLLAVGKSPRASMT